MPPTSPALDIILTVGDFSEQATQDDFCNSNVNEPRSSATLEALHTTLREAGGDSTEAGRPPAQKKRGRRRHMSADGRARVAEATRKRWAEKSSGNCGDRKEGEQARSKVT